MAEERLQDELENDMKFTDGFDPNRSRQVKSKPIYDATGRIRRTKKNVCDCLNNLCIGCHFPCKQCGSTKCGPKCRVKRNDYTAQIRIDGQKNKHTVINPNFDEMKN